MRTYNIVYSKMSPGTPETYTGSGELVVVSTTNHNLTGSTGRMRIWKNGTDVTGSPSADLLGVTYINGSTQGHILLSTVAIESALNAVDANENVWHYSLSITHLTDIIHVCSGYLIRLQP